jgi:hypothetical protein
MVEASCKQRLGIDWCAQQKRGITTTKNSESGARGNFNQETGTVQQNERMIDKSKKTKKEMITRHIKT